MLVYIFILIINKLNYFLYIYTLPVFIIFYRLTQSRYTLHFELCQLQVLGNSTRTYICIIIN